MRASASGPSLKSLREKPLTVFRLLNAFGSRESHRKPQQELDAARTELKKARADRAEVLSELKSFHKIAGRFYIKRSR